MPDPADLLRRRVRVAPKTSTRRTTSNGRADVPPGDLRRAPHRDAARQARLPHRRGRRRLRRRVQGLARLPGGVRAVARHRRAARRDGDRRRVHRRVDDGAPPGRGDAVRGLRLVRMGPPRHGRGEAALARRHSGADRRAPSLGRRLLGRAVPLAEPGVVVRAHPRSQVRLPGDARGREGTADQRDRGSEPRPLLRAQASVPPHQGRGARGALHGADRQGAHAPRSATTSRSSRGARWCTPPRRPRSNSRTTASRSRSSTCAASCRGTRPRCSTPSRKTSKALVLHEDTRTGGFGAEIAATIAEEAFEDLDAPVKRIAAPDTPVPFSPPLEKAFIPQVEDVVAGLRDLAGIDGDRDRRRRRHAADGRLRLGGDGHEVAQARRRADRGRRAAARDLDGQGRHRGAEPRVRNGRRRSSSRRARRSRSGRSSRRSAAPPAAPAPAPAAPAGCTAGRARTCACSCSCRRSTARRRRRLQRPSRPATGSSSRPSSRASPPSTASIRTRSLAPAAVGA